MADNPQKKHGGKRERAGRRPSKKTLPGGADFALEVLDRIADLELPGIKDKVDYALSLLKAADLRIRKEVFLALLLWQYGRPPQSLEVTGKDGGAIPVEHTIRFGDGKRDKG